MDQASVYRGLVLAIAFTLGIGLPFILLASGVKWASKSVTFVKKHIRTFNLVGGGLLVVLGVLMATGLWRSLMSSLQEVTVGFVPAI
jgi:cytochrome c-type biogenesis protein